MAKKKKVKKKTEKTFITKTAWRLLGLFMIVFSVALIISSITYCADDPSFNVANNNIPQNWLGLFGAHLSSLVVPFFGAALPVFIIAPIFWGYDFLRLREFIFGSIRIIAFIIGTIALSIFFAILPQAELGGAVGQVIAEKLMFFLNPYDYSNIVAAVIFFVVAFLSFNFAVGIGLKHWYMSVALILKVFAKLKPSVKKAPKKETKLKPIKEIRERKEPKVKEEPIALIKEEKKKFEEISKKAKETSDDYEYPSINLLSKHDVKNSPNISKRELDNIARELEKVLQEFGVFGNIVKVRPGPVVTLYELEPSAGTKSARVIGLADDIARTMSVSSVRIAVVSGSNTIGIEMPNTKRETVWLRELLEDDKFTNSKNDLNIVLGKDIGGGNTYADLAKMPHLLVAGTTGSGKSVGVNSMILSLLYRMRPDECKFIMIDPKMLEFSMYNGIPHLLTPVITDPAKAVVGLKWAVKEMEDRYRAMAQLNVRNITGYNQKVREIQEKGGTLKRTVQTGFDNETGKPIFEEQEFDLSPLPYIVIVVDEMADLMLVAGKDVEAAIQRLAQMARAAGLHLIMSTQRPSVDVITGTIKANFPTRISFQVTSKIDSRTILGEQGAEQLLGRGDMLYMPAGQRPIRIHGAFIPDNEVEKVVEFLKSERAPEYITEVTAGELNTGKDSGSVFDKGAFGGEDDIYNQAVDIVRSEKKASTSFIQRKLRIGYNKAASIIDRMEEEGIVSKADGIGRREVL